MAHYLLESVGNKVDDRIEVWELKTFADSGGGSFDEQASLYAHALTTVDVGLAPTGS